MARSKIHVGLEIGTSKICMVVGEVKSDNSITILGLGEAKSVGVRKGEIYDFPQVRACLKEALVKTEDASDVEIGSVLVAVTGSHFIGENHSGTVRLPEGENVIDAEHLDEAKELARDLALPEERIPLHHIVRNFQVDGFEQASTPIGNSGSTVSANFHIVHGIRSRIENQIRCVREIPLEFDDVIFAPLAMAQVCLKSEDRHSGALVIDMGAGTTDYVLYAGGIIQASGCIAVGGDHVTNDIHLVTELPFSKANRLKIQGGNASGDPAKSVGEIKIADEKGFSELTVKRALLNEIIYARLEEVLSLLKERLPKDILDEYKIKILLTGGASRMEGFGELTERVFGASTYIAETSELSGAQTKYRDPEYSTAVGLIRFAQIAEFEKAPRHGLWARLRNLFR